MIKSVTIQLTSEQSSQINPLRDEALRMMLTNKATIIIGQPDPYGKDEVKFQLLSHKQAIRVLAAVDIEGLIRQIKSDAITCRGEK